MTSKLLVAITQSIYIVWILEILRIFRTYIRPHKKIVSSASTQSDFFRSGGRFLFLFLSSLFKRTNNKDQNSILCLRLAYTKYNKIEQTIKNNFFFYRHQWFSSFGHKGRIHHKVHPVAWISVRGPLRNAFWNAVTAARWLVLASLALAGGQAQWGHQETGNEAGIPAGTALKQ